MLAEVYNLCNIHKLIVLDSDGILIQGRLFQNNTLYILPIGKYVAKLKS